MIKKLVIPAAGFGTRLLSITKEIPKEMMPIFVRNKSGIISVKPIIQIIFEQFYNIGIREYCVVVGRQKRAIEDHFTPDNNFLKNLKNTKHKTELNNFYTKLKNSRIFWINQLYPKGFGDAVLQAESFVDIDDFLVIAGDTLILKTNEKIRDLISTKLIGKNDATILLKEVPDPRRYGVAVVRETKKGIFVKNVEEKPLRPKSKLSIVALYHFKPSIFEALKSVKTRKSELQLTDGIQKLIERGGNVKAIIIDKKIKVIDIGTPESYLENLVIG